MVRRENWKYCHYLDFPDELYDLASDPGETDNRADDPAHDALRHELRGRLLVGWDHERARRTAERRDRELPMIQEWIRTAGPPEPIAPWFDGPQENWVDTPDGGSRYE